MTQDALLCQDLSIAYPGVVALQDISLSVPKGDILAVLGPSGCGKTTLLRLIAGFEIPDQGTIRIHGQAVAGRGVKVPTEKRRVGMVFQEYALFPHLSVADNIAFGLQAWASLERQQRIEHLLRLIDLEGLQSRYPDELSGGQRQRVALARALAPEPHLLLLDEPFSNLDTDRRVQMREQVRHILKASGATSVIVTHDQEEALFMGDHLALLRAGRLEQVDRPETVFMQPATRFVAEFLGRAEFIPATVGPQGLQTELGILLQTVDLEAGEKVSIGFRADDLTFVPDPNGDSMILARFFQGASTLYRLRLPSGLIVHSLQPHTLLLSPGTRVQALLEAGHPLPVFQGERAIPSRYQPVGHLRQAVIQSQLDG